LGAEGGCRDLEQLPLQYNKYTLDTTYLCLHVGRPGVVMGINAFIQTHSFIVTAGLKRRASVLFIHL
jgi:hypothetical protein